LREPLRYGKNRLVRRQPLIAFAALAVAGAVTLAWPSLGELARSPVPVGAVLPATASLAGPSPAPSVPPPSTPAGPSATPTLRPVVRRQPFVAPGRFGDGQVAIDPRRLSGYRWPLANGIISQPFGTSPFGALLVHGQRFHDGLDIASFCGDSVVAAHDGLVLAAGRRFDPYIGWAGSIRAHTQRMDRLHKWWELPITVIVDDGDGYRAIYAHFNAVAVKAGQYVHAGQRLGWEGSTGFATGCHVHFGLFSPVDPGRLELRPDVQKRTKYPAWEIARIDPLLVLPALPPGKTAGPFPSPSPSVGPSPSPSREPAR
jgi:hypothetical protein